jgi:hypothetical protein
MNDVMNNRVFGAGHAVCEYTGLPIESGHGALSREQQSIANVGKLSLQLAELTQRRKDHADEWASEVARRNTMHADHNAIRADDLIARQRSVYRLAEQDAVVANLERQSAALAADHEALAVKIAEAKTRLTEEGIIDRHGWGPASTYFGIIRDKGLQSQ